MKSTHRRIGDIDAEIEDAAKHLRAIAVGEAMAISDRIGMDLIAALRIERRALARAAKLLSVRIARLTEEMEG